MRLSSKGQVTVPKRLREKLRMPPGSKLLLVVTGGTLRVQPLRRSIVAQTAGSLRKYVSADKLCTPRNEMTAVRKKHAETTGMKEEDRV